MVNINEVVRCRLDAVSEGARATTITTDRGSYTTPMFMPVGTQATVKGLGSEELRQVGAQVLLANTYHLMLRPGAKVFQRLGGIQKFMNWSGSILTDSGGYQIFSLPNSRRITEEGATFRSYVDGAKVFLSPENSVAMQTAIGSDIMMVLDQCVPATVEESAAKQAMELTHRWAFRSLRARTSGSRQGLFGIVQGALYPKLRKESVDYLTGLNFDGYGIGGLAVGESKDERQDFTQLVTELLPTDRPRYLMGVGTPIDLLEAVKRGVDMFDCILPVALAQQGVAFTASGRCRLGRSAYKFADESLDEQCGCSTCTSFSKAYIHHLIKTGESYGWRLLAIHNLTFYAMLMSAARQAILGDQFPDFYRQWRGPLAMTDVAQPEDHRLSRRIRRQQNYAAALVRGNYKLSFNGQNWTMHQVTSGETMHPGSNPNTESQTLYIEGSHLALLSSLRSQLTIWDVGLGAGHNAMAAIRWFENEKTFAPAADEAKVFKASDPQRDTSVPAVQIYSFEQELDPFRLAIRHPNLLPHVRHPAPHRLLKDGSYEDPGIQLGWQLVHGDFAETFRQTPCPNVIFYDPFSTRTDKALWTADIFSKLFKVVEHAPCVLVTYTSATSVRAALLKAGFWVGDSYFGSIESESVGRTSSDAARNAGHTRTARTGTIAFTGQFRKLVPTVTKSLLGAEWLGRFSRSSRAWPIDTRADQGKLWRTAIGQHPQFSLISNNGTERSQGEDQTSTGLS